MGILRPDAERAVTLYGDSLYRLATVLLRDPEQAKDAVQDCFLRYIRKAPSFRDGEHEKAWLIRVTANVCNDYLRVRKRQQTLSLEEIRDRGVSEDHAQILGALASLELPYRSVLHLHYVEGYSVAEIAAMLKLTQAAVKKRLQRGRALLRQAYEADL
ncbi:MAG: sigma-70 family RNA polymerase sigma factor [Clostridia bacterium]|nr:sigma-70 family RNA polymerase sigma factor [Clostridia bacterium]